MELEPYDDPGSGFIERLGRCLCIVCLDILDDDCGRAEDVNDCGTGTNDNDCEAFHIFTSTFQLEIPKYVYNDVTLSKLKLCVKCKDSVIQIDMLLSQIRILQEEAMRMKARIKSTICKSRKWSQEKENKCVDVDVSMIRDLTTGVRVDLAHARTTTEHKTVENYQPTERPSPNKIKAKLWNPSFPDLDTEYASFDSNELSPERSEELVDDCESIEYSVTYDDDYPYDDGSNSSDSIIFETFVHKASSSTSTNSKNKRSSDNKDSQIIDVAREDDFSEEYFLSSNNVNIGNNVDQINEPKQYFQPMKKSSKPYNKRNKQAKGTLETSALSRGPKLKVDTTEDGRAFYRDIEILKIDNGFQCSICNDKKFFKYQLSAVLHIKKHHVPDKDGWFQCETCGKQYLHKSLLELHQLAHINEKPLMCDICGRMFKLKSTLSGHRKTHGDRPKSFCCEFCGKQFAHMRDCVVHTRTHTKERPYKCDICPKSFIVRTLLNTHMKKHADIMPSKLQGKDSVPAESVSIPASDTA